MRQMHFACSVFVAIILIAGGASHCAGSEQEQLIVRGGKKLICWVRFPDIMSGDCGTESYDAVFTAKISAVKQLPRSSRQDDADAMGATVGSDLLLTVEPEEVFKGHPPRQMQISAKQGECFPEIHIGDDWLFFGNWSADTHELAISYYASNPSGPVEQRSEYIERLRRLARGDGFSYVTGEVDFPSFDFSKGSLSNPQANHRLLIKTKDGKQSYSIATDAEGRFEMGPVAPGFYQIDANTDPQFRSIWAYPTTDGALAVTNGCSFVRIELEINSEISGRVILPEGYQYTKSNIGNYFPLFSVDVDTPDGKQVRGTSIGDGLKFTVRGLAPGSYIVQLVNYEGQTWIKMPVFAPGVTDQSTALRIDLGLAEHKTGIEIRVPPEALKDAH